MVSSFLPRDLANIVDEYQNEVHYLLFGQITFKGLIEINLISAEVENKNTYISMDGWITGSFYEVIECLLAGKNNYETLLSTCYNGWFQDRENMRPGEILKNYISEQVSIEDTCFIYELSPTHEYSSIQRCNPHTSWIMLKNIIVDFERRCKIWNLKLKDENEDEEF